MCPACSVSASASSEAPVIAQLNALEGGGADEARRFADEERVVVPEAELPHTLRPQHRAGLRIDGRAEVEIGLRQPLFLRLEGFAAALRLEYASVDERVVLGDGPRAEAAGGSVEDAGIEGALGGSAEMLLNGDIALQGRAGIEERPHDRSRAVRADKDARANFRVSRAQDVYAAPPLDRGADAAVEVHPVRHSVHQPAVEAGAVHIQIAALVVCRAAGLQIHRFNSENLRRYQHVGRQRHIEARKRALRVGREKPAAGLAEAVRCTLFVDYSRRKPAADQPRERGARRPRADDGDIVDVRHRRRPRRR